MKKFLALLLTLAMVSSLLCGMTVFAEDVTDGETNGETNLLADGNYTVDVVVTGDDCLSLEGQTINPWADSSRTYLEYTVKDGVIQNLCTLYCDYYKMGYWPTRSEVRGGGSFGYLNDSTGMEIVIPSAVGAVTLAKGYDQEVSYEAANPISFSGYGVSGTNYAQSNNNNSIFNGKSGWSKVIVSEGITTISYGAFAKAKPTDITIVLPSTLTAIGQYFIGGAGSGTGLIKSIKIIGNMPSIPTNCFTGLSNLKTLDLSEVTGLTTINNLLAASTLETIKIPASVTNIPSGALAIKTLTNIEIASDNATYSAENGVVYSKDRSTLVAYPTASGSYTIPDSITAIGNGAFSGCATLVSIDIPESITSYPQEMLSGCSALTTINGMNGYYDLSHVTYAGTSAFNGCNALTGTMKIGLTKLLPTIFQNTSLSKVILVNDFEGNGNAAIFKPLSGDYNDMVVVCLGRITNTNKGYYANPVYYPADVTATNFTSSKSYFNGPKTVFGGYIDSVSVDGDNTTVTYTNASSYGGKKGLLAFYKTVDGQAVLVAVKTVTLTDDIKNFVTVTVEGTQGAETVKLLTWEDLTSATPLFAPWTESLAEEVVEEPAA